MEERSTGQTQEKSSLKSGFSERSGRRLENGEILHLNDPQVRQYRTRTDVFEQAWSKIVEPMLQTNPGLLAKTILGHLQRTEPGRYSDGTVRTLQRRIRNWRRDNNLLKKDRIFPQNHYPGQMGICDFTDMNNLCITIGGMPFLHKVFHFRMSYSGWSWAEVILGGESFPALGEGLERSLSALGGAPRTLRTDSLSAAYKNRSKEEKEDFTASFEALIAHYGMQPTRNNRGVAHENGSIESPNGHLKCMLDQSLMLRGNRDFSTEAAYREWIRDLLRRANRERQVRLEEDLRALLPLPAGRPRTWREYSVLIKGNGLLTIDKVVYALESKWIDQRLRVHLFDDRLELFEGQDLVKTLCRKRHTKSDRDRHIYDIDYRVIIRQLVRKPGAFPNLRYRDEVHPCGIFRRCWEALFSTMTPREASKQYLAILLIAHEQACEHTVREEIVRIFEIGEIPTLAMIRQACCPARDPDALVCIDEPKIAKPELDIYDELVGASLDVQRW